MDEMKDKAYEIEFLESEILSDEDDGADVPVGTLVHLASEAPLIAAAQSSVSDPKPHPAVEPEEAPQVVDPPIAEEIPAEPRIEAAADVAPMPEAEPEIEPAAAAAPLKKKKAPPAPADTESIWQVAPVAKKAEASKKEDKASGADAPLKEEKSASAPKKKSPKAESEKSAKAVRPAAKKAEKKEEPKPASAKKTDGETVIEAGEADTPHGKFVIKKTEKGNFVYKLYSFNHRVVAIGGEQYGALASCKAGIQSVRNNAENAPVEDQTLQKWEEKKCPKWQIYTDKKGEIRLRLLASNGNIVATTNDGYLSKGAAKNGIEAIARAAKGSAIVRNDCLW